MRITRVTWASIEWLLRVVLKTTACRTPRHSAEQHVSKLNEKEKLLRPLSNCHFLSRTEEE
ncbi:hypothetical protein X777_13373 [Ooceraea biroi]|uniref:Uncharacterized protein n=1 Tax=Ooceraea biroi TaxID=2015173 RepID=A0A026WYR4_OOCBI|nr:hypothetical protein X777_13373 [Ooceraea biroi]